MQALGLPFDVILDDMTLPRFRALVKSWATDPPVHITVARYLGIGKGTSPDSSGSAPSGAHSGRIMSQAEAIADLTACGFTMGRPGG